MNTFQLSCFLAVANSLNFAKAAEQMNISQPAITHQIKSLETELNVKLFYRSTRLVELTAEGRSFLSDAQSIVAIAAQAKLRFHDPREKPAEKLSIACSSYYQLLLLSNSLHELREQVPNLRPLLSVVPQEQLLQLLDRGTADVICDVQDGTKFSGKYTFKELCQSPIVCVCREDHPLANVESVSMRELQPYPLVFCNPINLAPEMANMQWKLAEGRNPSDLYFCDSIEAAVVLASAGFGLAVLPRLFAPINRQLVTVSLNDAPQLSFGMFYKPYPGDDVLRKLIQISKQHFSLPER